MISITKATLEDLDELNRLFDAYRVFYEKGSDLAGSRAFLRERIEKNESEIYLAKDEDNRYTGFVGLYPLFSSTRMKRLWLLNDLFVAPEHRGKGISIRLIKAAKELCRRTDACGMMLETAKSNDIGNNLYPKTFFELDEDHNYYSWDVSMP